MEAHVRPIISATDKGVQLTIELEPESVTVGVGGTNPQGPASAIVAVVYENLYLPLIKFVLRHMKMQGRSPVVAVFEDNIQIVLMLSPIPPDYRAHIANMEYVGQFAADMKSFNVTSVADVFPTDPSYAVFEKCYARDKSLTLLFMDMTSRIDQTGGVGTSFAVFSVKELKREFQRII